MHRLGAGPLHRVNFMQLEELFMILFMFGISTSSVSKRHYGFHYGQWQLLVKTVGGHCNFANARYLVHFQKCPSVLAVAVRPFN